MQVDGLAIALRPRSMVEAADLGVLLVQRHARSIWLTYTPVLLGVTFLAMAAVHIAPWLASLLIFWFKPWLDRTLLFVLSRAVFGQPTRWGDLWANRAAVWWHQSLSTLTVRRLSPWRGYTQAAYQLEGQRGSALRKRRAQLLRGKRGNATALQFVFSNVELVFTLGLVAIAVWFAPQELRGQVFRWLMNSTESVEASLVFAAIYATAVLVLEPFYVAAGFAMYLNRRVELEAWDIEQEFRRAFA